MTDSGELGYGDDEGCVGKVAGSVGRVDCIPALHLDCLWPIGVDVGQLGDMDLTLDCKIGILMDEEGRNSSIEG